MSRARDRSAVNTGSISGSHALITVSSVTTSFNGLSESWYSTNVCVVFTRLPSRAANVCEEFTTRRNINSVTLRRPRDKRRDTISARRREPWGRDVLLDSILTIATISDVFTLWMAGLWVNSFFGVLNLHELC